MARLSALRLKAARSGGVALAALVAIAAVCAGEPTGVSRDPGMRRIVASFQNTASSVPRRFRTDLAAAVSKCGRDCDREALVRALVEGVTRAQRSLSAALVGADQRLRERARSVHGADGVLGAAGELSRSVASLEMVSLRASSQVTESLAALKGKGFGGQPLLTTVQLRMVSLVYKIPIGLGTTFTLHTVGGPNAYVYMDGYAPSGTPVTVTITCGGGPPLVLESVTSDDGWWSVSSWVELGGATICAVTVSAGTGIGASTLTTELQFQ